MMENNKELKNSKIKERNNNQIDEMISNIPDFEKQAEEFIQV